MDSERGTRWTSTSRNTKEEVQVDRENWYKVDFYKKFGELMKVYNFFS